MSDEPQVLPWDYGDDIKDYEIKEKEAWNLELQNNPIYKGNL